MTRNGLPVLPTTASGRPVTLELVNSFARTILACENRMRDPMEMTGCAPSKCYRLKSRLSKTC